MGNTELLLQEAYTLISNEQQEDNNFLLAQAAETRMLNTGFTAQMQVTHVPCTVFVQN